MAALPDALDDLSAPAGGGERALTPRPDESGDVKMGGMPTDPKAGANAGTGGGKKKKKGKK
jgi:hypothetical protein